MLKFFIVFCQLEKQLSSSALCDINSSTVLASATLCVRVCVCASHAWHSQKIPKKKQSYSTVRALTHTLHCLALILYPVDKQDQQWRVFRWKVCWTEELLWFLLIQTTFWSIFFCQKSFMFLSSTGYYIAKAPFTCHCNGFTYFFVQCIDASFNFRHFYDRLRVCPLGLDLGTALGPACWLHCKLIYNRFSDNKWTAPPQSQCSLTTGNSCLLQAYGDSPTFPSPTPPLSHSLFLLWLLSGHAFYWISAWQRQPMTIFHIWHIRILIKKYFTEKVQLSWHYLKLSYHRVRWSNS